jgi:hypothetical protein
VTTDLQRGVAGFLSRVPWLVGHQVEVFPEDLQDISSRIKSAVAKFGVCAIVSMPAVRAQSAASRAIVAEADFSVEVYETPLTNRTRANFATSTQAAEVIAAELNLAPIPLGPDGAPPVILPVFVSYDSAAASGAGILTTVRFRAQVTIAPFPAATNP